MSGTLEAPGFSTVISHRNLEEALEVAEKVAGAIVSSQGTTSEAAEKVDFELLCIRA